MNFPEINKKLLDEAKLQEKHAECLSAEWIGAKTRCAIEKIMTLFDSHKDQQNLKAELMRMPEQLRWASVGKVPADLFDIWDAQKEIAKYPHAKKDDDVIALLRAPDGSRHYISLKQSFKENDKTLYATVGWKRLKFYSEKTNWYNTEYVVTDSQGGIWKPLSILYTSTNPDYREAMKKVERLEERLEEIKKSEAAIAAERKLIEKKKGSKKIGKKALADIRSRNEQLAEKSADLTKAKNGLKTELAARKKEAASIEPKVHFPYTPYAKIYESPENTSVGFHYLNKAVRNAWSTPELQKLNSRLGRNADMLTTRAIPPEIAITLNIVERMSYQEYFRTAIREKTIKLPRKKGQKKDRYATVKEKVTELKPKAELEALMNSQIEKALTTFSLNLDHAFVWQRSGVGALGIAQIMPKTHDLFRNKYPSILKAAKFERAAMDHTESFRLQALHLADEGRQLPPQSIQRNWEAIMSDDSAKVWLYAILAAGYNGSMSRIKDETIQEANQPLWPSKIRELLNPETLIRKTAWNEETMTYILKFKYVWEYLSRRFPESFDSHRMDFAPQLIAYNEPISRRK